MTVLLVLLFVMIAIAANEVIEWKKKRATQPKLFTANGIVQELFEHDGACPTMADGGEKVDEKK